MVRAFGREPLPEVVLEFLNGPSRATVWPMNRVMSLIGSAQGCKFRLTDPSVSAFHASLLRTPTGLWAVDLRGGRSISINGEPVRFGPLADGDVLGIGRYRMKVRCRESGAGNLDPGESSSGLPAHRLLGGLARRPAAGGVPAMSAFAGPLPPMPGPSIPVVASAAGVELVASDAGLHGRLHPEVTDSVLVPLVNQFSMMQQQMFDQFQQAMGMLVQMFSSMHREQMEVIREELDRLHDLSRELQELKEELAGSRGRPAPAASPAEPVAAPSPPEAAAVADRRPVEAPVASADRPAGAAPAEVPSAEVPTTPPQAGAAGSRQPAGPVVAPPPRPTRPPVPSPPTGPRPDQRPPGVAAPGSGGAPQDAVAWIHHRIAAIQQERETRWQKILKILPGMS